MKNFIKGFCCSPTSKYYANLAEDANLHCVDSMLG